MSAFDAPRDEPRLEEARAEFEERTEPKDRIWGIDRKLIDEAVALASNVTWPMRKLLATVAALAAIAVGIVMLPTIRTSYEPGATFRDCDDCPEMIVIPAGRFVMGSPADEAERDGDEGPQREVTIGQRFALGKYEVTFAEWDVCVAAGDCSHEPGDEGWGRGDRPVINVSWEDAQSYVSWLSEKTGESYRLASEAEWEYAARAGTTTAYWWGGEIGSGHANCYGCGTEGDNKQTAPGGSFAANEFGLHDTAGNVWEWVEDCWNATYVGALTDGTAWLQGDCSGRVLHGGSWSSVPGSLRSANRYRNEPVFWNVYIGIRVAGALTT